MFASTSLAARIESAETRLIEDSARAAARRHPEAGGCIARIAGGVAAFTTEGSPLGRLDALGASALSSTGH